MSKPVLQATLSTTEGGVECIVEQYDDDEYNWVLIDSFSALTQETVESWLSDHYPNIRKIYEEP